jgi:hypothetical protein
MYQTKEDTEIMEATETTEESGKGAFPYPLLSAPSIVLHVSVVAFLLYSRSESLRRGDIQGLVDLVG